MGEKLNVSMIGGEVDQMLLVDIIDQAVELGKVFDIIDIKLGNNGLMEKVVVDWNPELCKNVNYWYDNLKPRLPKAGRLEFYRLSSSSSVDFIMKYKNISYKDQSENAYLVIADNMNIITNYQWYKEYSNRSIPSNVRRAIYKWNVSYSRWEEKSKYTSANIDQYSGISDSFNNIVDDLNLIKNSSDILEKLGLSPSINYLISSAPGMGKTSLIKCIATHLNVDIYVLDHGAVSNSDPSSIFSSIKTNDNHINIYIFEDFDRYLKTSKSEQMASLLNALDGVEKMPPSLRFFTANSRIVGEEFKAFYTRMRRVIHFHDHNRDAYERSIKIVLGEVDYIDELIELFTDHSISMREANQLLVSSISCLDDKYHNIKHNIQLRESMRN